jgi:hypothetical protein
MTQDLFPMPLDDKMSVENASATESDGDASDGSHSSPSKKRKRNLKISYV